MGKTTHPIPSYLRQRRPAKSSEDSKVKPGAALPQRISVLLSGTNGRAPRNGMEWQVLWVSMGLQYGPPSRSRELLPEQSGLANYGLWMSMVDVTN